MSLREIYRPNQTFNWPKSVYYRSGHQSSPLNFTPWWHGMHLFFKAQHQNHPPMIYQTSHCVCHSLELWRRLHVQQHGCEQHGGRVWRQRRAALRQPVWPGRVSEQRRLHLPVWCCLYRWWRHMYCQWVTMLVVLLKLKKYGCEISSKCVEQDNS